MSSITEKRFSRSQDASEIVFLKYKWVHEFDLTVPPRVKQEDAATAIADDLFNQHLEVIGDATTDPAACSYPVGKGLRITTAANIDDPALLMPLLGLAAMVTPFVNGHATARASCSIGNAFKTGAAADADSGKGIEFATVLSIPTITTMEAMTGLSGKTIPTVGPKLTDGLAGNLNPDDGFYFMYNTEVGANWYACVNFGTTDEKSDTGVPATAGLPILLSAELTLDRVPVFKINGAVVYTGTALDAETKICPFVSVKALAGTAARSVDILNWRVGRQW